VFEQPAVASAAADLVMVHQDQDQPAAWLKDQLIANMRAASAGAVR
jgi:hypothetical protein